MGWPATLRPHVDQSHREHAQWRHPPCPFPRVLVISQSDCRGRVDSPLGRITFTSQWFLQRDLRVRACVRACTYVQIADRETRRAQWCHPSRSLFPFLPPFLLVTGDSLSLAFPIYGPFLPFYFGALERSPSTLLSLPIPAVRDPFSLLVSRCRYYLHDKRCRSSP